MTIAGELTSRLQVEDERVVYIDGIENFGAKITASGEFICEWDKKDICPDTT